MYERYIKRILDIVVSCTAIIILFPVILITAIIVRIKLGGPVIFRQARPGKNEKIFYMYKFRSMTDEKDENGELLPDEKRLKSFGRLLRATSLDELPELFNVLKGDMSIVGPRPLLVKYLPLYNEVQKQRHNVRPGLTGLAQINGRNSLEWEDKFRYDVEYVQSVSFFRDIRICLYTVKKVLKREGINSGTSVTMEEFKGERK